MRYVINIHDSLIYAIVDDNDAEILFIGDANPKEYYRSLLLALTAIFYHKPSPLSMIHISTNVDELVRESKKANNFIFSVFHHVVKYDKSISNFLAIYDFMTINYIATYNLKKPLTSTINKYHNSKKPSDNIVSYERMFLEWN